MGTAEACIIEKPPYPCIQHPRWGTVCDDGWSNVDASVVCKELGFSGGVAIANDHFTPAAPASQNIWLDRMECEIEDSALAQCSSSGVKHSADPLVKIEMLTHDGHATSLCVGASTPSGVGELVMQPCAAAPRWSWNYMRPTRMDNTIANAYLPCLSCC